MEADTVSGIVDDTEDSDISLLIVNDDDDDDDENIGAGSNDNASLRVPDTVVCDGTASNPVLEMEVEATCAVSGAVIQDAVVATTNDVNCPRHRRRTHRRHRSVTLPFSVLY